MRTAEHLWQFLDGDPETKASISSQENKLFRWSGKVFLDSRAALNGQISGCVCGEDKNK